MEEDKIDIKDKIGIRDIHQTLWRCRDFELTNLWQRSIFLTAFLVLCFTAYGAVVSKIADNLDKQNVLILMNIIGYLLSIIGSIFSIFWIKMGKGSKAWYEIYEAAIRAFEQNKKYTTKLASAIGGFGYPKLENYQRHNALDNKLLSGNAGPYSVSKINIAIGQVFLIVWSILGFFHIGIASILSFKNYPCCYVLIPLIFGLTLVAIPFWLSHRKRLRSRSIKGFYPRLGEKS